MSKISSSTYLALPPISTRARLCTLALGCALSVNAATTKPSQASKNLDIDSRRLGWLIDISRISINFSSTTIRNQEDYEQFANSRLSGDSQLIMQGFGYMLADYYAQRFVFFNSLLAEYGETMVVLAPRIHLRNKTLDRILLSTGYTQRVWNLGGLGGGEVGPYAQLSLQSEFTPSLELPYRKKIFRFAVGARLFDGSYIENLKLNLFGEEDFSDSQNPIESMGLESGLSLKHTLREGVQFRSMINYRYYLLNNYPNTRNPEQELECSLHLDTTLWGDFTISPFISFYLLQGRYITSTASNLFIGISLGYGRVLRDNKLPLERESQVDSNPL